MIIICVSHVPHFGCCLALVYCVFMRSPRLTIDSSLFHLVLTCCALHRQIVTIQVSTWKRTKPLVVYRPITVTRVT